MGDDCPFDTVCFHAQQAAEKCIKAVLTRLQLAAALDAITPVPAGF